MFEAIEILLAAVMVFTAFLSGVFGMAGGMILIGLLLYLLPLPEAMALHAITQLSSNGWRAFLWRKFVRWKRLTGFIAGSGLAMAVWSIWLFVPSKAVASFFLGLSPFLVRLLPDRLKPRGKTADGVAYGGGCMSLMLLTGVSGPLVDAYFLASDLERREIVATKAIAQCAGHGAKLLYFGGLAATAGALDLKMALVAVLASIAGASLAKPVLTRISEGGYRRWANRILTAIAIFYLGQAGWLAAG